MKKYIHKLMPMKISTLFLLLAILLFQKNEVAAQCNPDVDPPTPYCLTGLVVGVPSNGTVAVFGQDFDAGAFDNCTAAGQLEFRIEEAPASTAPPPSISLDFGAGDVGLHSVVVWVIDEAGNADYCATLLEVQLCTPNLACNALVEVSIAPGETVEIHPNDILEGGPYCLDLMMIEIDPPATPLPYLTLDTSFAGTHVVKVQQYLNGVPGNSCWGELQVNGSGGNCQGDAVPPIAVCDAGLIAQLGEDGPGLTTIWATDIDEGSYDNCTDGPNLDLRLGTAVPPPATPPATQSLDFAAPGTYTVVLWVGDENGNWNQCWATVQIIGNGCPGDTEPPICTAPADVLMSNEAFDALGIAPNDLAALETEFGAATATDNCGVFLVEDAVELTYEICSAQSILREIKRSFVAYDSAGNVSPVVSQVITLLPEFSISLPADYHPGDPSIEDLDVENGTSSLLGITFSDQVFDFNCDGQADKIVRTWGVLNWCNFDLQEPETPLPSLDLDGDGQAGDAYEVFVGADSVYLLENGVPTTGLAARNEYFTYKQILRFNENDTLHFTLNGTVFHDTLTDCTFANEPTLEGWLVHVEGLVSGQTYTATTDADGYFEISLCTSDTLVEVSLDVPFNYGQSCPTTHTAAFVPGVNQTVTQDVPVKLDNFCPLLHVDLSAPLLRRCFENYYAVSYASFSAQTIEDAWVEVTLDEAMSFNSSTIPGTALGDNRYSFEVGNLEPGENGNFKIYFDLSCDAPLGATHCSEAHIYPDTLCPQLATWSGANIEVEGVCENDTIRLTIKNTGTGNMAQPLDFIVVEDVIMYQQGTFDLEAAQSEQVLSMPANGATWRLEAEQEPNHPFPGNVAIAVEGCNGLNTTGLINLFPLGTPNPFVALDCQENIGSFDPNDKRAFPAGFGDEHFIEKNTPLEYLIRFQNTGTDTAFKVVILDTLSLHLDPVSVVPGAGSHPYRFEVMDENVLRFTFDEIMLPDSNVNEPASHGFVKFQVRQQPDLPLGTVIENSAAIYFDFNEPVITNTAWHTIGEDFIEVINDVSERPDGFGKLLAYPNPGTGHVNFDIPGNAFGDGTFVLHDHLGKVVRTEQIAGNRFRFERRALAAGIYFYSIENEGVRLYSGKVILK